jgi:hypothetical protein
LECSKRRNSSAARISFIFASRWGFGRLEPNISEVVHECERRSAKGKTLNM